MWYVQYAHARICSILNKAAYLLANGGLHNGVQVDGIGRCLGGNQRDAVYASRLAAQVLDAGLGLAVLLAWSTIAVSRGD